MAGLAPTSTFLNEDPAVVVVKLLVCMLEKRPNQGFRLGYATVDGPDSEELRDTISWLLTGQMRKKIGQAIAALAGVPRMPTAATSTIVFPRYFPLYEETFDQASDAVRDDNIVDVEERGEYGYAVLVLEDRATGATEVVATSNVKTQVAVKTKTLREMYLVLKRGECYALSNGVWVVGMAPAFLSSAFIPIVYQGKAKEVPSAVLRSNGHYDFLVPVEGAKSDKVVTCFKDGSWEVQESVYAVRKSETDRILQMEADGYCKGDPAEFDGELDPEEQYIMVRQELIQKVFRCGPT
jgi:hypothetical protein